MAFYLIVEKFFGLVGMSREKAEKLCKILEEKGTKMRNEEIALHKKCFFLRRVVSSN